TQGHICGGITQDLLGATGHRLAGGVHAALVLSSSAGCSALLLLEIAQLFGVLGDSLLRPLHLSRQALLFLRQTSGINTRRLRRLFGAPGFRCQLVQLAGSTCCLALGHAQRVSQALAARVLVQLLTQISCALLGALERGSCPLRRLAGTTQANRQALSAFGLVQLLCQLLASVTDLVQVLGYFPGFRREFVLAPENKLNQAVFNRHGRSEEHTSELQS